MANPNPSSKKKIRNKRRVYEFWLEHPTRSYASIGRTFNNISRQRVSVIINEFKELEKGG